MVTPVALASWRWQLISRPAVSFSEPRSGGLIEVTHKSNSIPTNDWRLQKHRQQFHLTVTAEKHEQQLDMWLTAEETTNSSTCDCDGWRNTNNSLTCDLDSWRNTSNSLTCDVDSWRNTNNSLTYDCDSWRNTNNSLTWLWQLKKHKQQLNIWLTAAEIEVSGLNLGKCCQNWLFYWNLLLLVPEITFIRTRPNPTVLSETRLSKLQHHSMLTGYIAILIIIIIIIMIFTLSLMVCNSNVFRLQLFHGLQYSTLVFYYRFVYLTGFIRGLELLGRCLHFILPFHRMFTNVNCEVLSSLRLACCPFWVIGWSHTSFHEISHGAKGLTFMLSDQVSQLGIHHCVHVSKHYMEYVRCTEVRYGNLYFRDINMAMTPGDWLSPNTDSNVQREKGLQENWFL